MIKHGRVVTPGRDSVADIFVDGEKIIAVGPNLQQYADTILDASGRIVIPGGVDVHTHLDAPIGQYVSRDDFESGTRAAAFGGTTSLVDFATQTPGRTLREAFDTWLGKAERSLIDYSFHMIIADWSAKRRGEMAWLAENGVTSFKVFMAYPGRLMLDDGQIYEIMQQSRELGTCVCVHAENGPLIDSLTRAALGRGDTGPVYHALTRPPEAEAEATHRAIALARLAGCPLYVVHVSCREALEELRFWRERGAEVSGETCPHYLLLSREALDQPGLEGAKYVLTPPLRESIHGESLWEGLAADTLQVVSTDHCPFDFSGQKTADAGDFTRIPNGAPGIEHRLELLFDRGVLTGRISLERWVEIVSTQPARLFGLYPAKGAIAPGSDADIVVWDPATQHTISASTHHMNVDYSLYEGYVVRGRAETVIARGEIILSQGAWNATPGRGRFLRRARWDPDAIRSPGSPAKVPLGE